MALTGLDHAALDLQDALDLAILVEEEAAERYRDFAAQLAAHGTPDAAELFAALSIEEERHGADLAHRRQARFAGAPRRVHRGMLWDVEAPGFEHAQAFMGARLALAVAMAAEGKARAFYADLAAHARDAEAKALFAELEAEEVEHQARLKRALLALPADRGGEPPLSDGTVAQ
jgi:rubrerythrin